MPRQNSLIGRLLRSTLFPPRPAGPPGGKRFLVLLMFIPLFLLVQGIHWVGFFMDDVFFRGYRRVEVREPLFIVGLPRSGTTFLQRVLARDSGRFTTLRLWELLLAPSVTERKFWLALGKLDRMLGRPVGRLAGWGGDRSLGFLEAIHEVSLTDPEEDYFLLLPIFACFLLVVPFPFHDAVWRLGRFDQLPEEERKPIMRFYRAAVQRHLYVVGPEKQLLSKNPSFTSFIASLREEFHDARILCCVRDPLEVVPSQLSSLRSGGRVFGWDVGEPAIRDRFLALLQGYAENALRTLGDLEGDRHAWVPLRELKADPQAFVLKVYNRFGWEPDPGFRERLGVESDKGKKYKSRHRYTLEEFGLDAGEVRERFRALNDTVGFPSREDAESPALSPVEGP